jgi:hypothetical protein
MRQVGSPTLAIGHRINPYEHRCIVEDDWTEEDEAQMADLVKKIDALAEDDELGEGEDDPEDIDSDHD